jgi:hypothetical protein
MKAREEGIARYPQCKLRKFSAKPWPAARRGHYGIETNTSDPIIAAIEAHRRACAETRAAYERQGAVADELGAGVRVPAGETQNDPRWTAANDAAVKALAVRDDLAAKLLETRPTTIAGATALLTYYVDAIATTPAEVIFPDLDVIGRQLESKSNDESRRDFGYLIVRNVATALSNMVANVAAQSVAAHDDTVPVSVLRSGVVDGMTYALYSDRSIEAQLPEGILRFGSIAELRNYLGQSV